MTKELNYVCSDYPEIPFARTNSPIVGGKALTNALGFPSQGAFRQALYRGTLPVPVFAVPNRRGKFAFVIDIECWRATLGHQIPAEESNGGSMEH